MSKLDRYIRKHEHPYTLEVPNGKGTIQVLFYDGYVTLRSRQPGAHFVQEIHIRRRSWLKLLTAPQLKTGTKAMEGPDFDRYRAERIYYRQEREHLEALRAQKALRRGKRRRRRLRSRL